MGYIPSINGSIIDRSWRGESISSVAESGASVVGARSEEGLEDEEGLEAMWTTTGDGPIWEGCGVDVRGAGTTIRCGVGTPAVCGGGTIVGWFVGTIVGDDDWMGVLWAGPVCEGCGVDVDGVVAITGCGVGTLAGDDAWMGALCGIWLGTFMI